MIPCFFACLFLLCLPSFSLSFFLFFFFPFVYFFIFFFTDVSANKTDKLFAKTQLRCLIALTFYSNTKTLEHRCSHTLRYRNSRAQMVPYCKAQLVHRYWAPIALDSNERKPRHITGTTGPMQSFYRIMCPCRTQINNARNVHSHMDKTYCVSIKYL